jgi:hypothetical protein
MNVAIDQGKNVRVHISRALGDKDNINPSMTMHSHVQDDLRRTLKLRAKDISHLTFIIENDRPVWNIPPVCG